MSAGSQVRRRLFIFSLSLNCGTAVKQKSKYDHMPVFGGQAQHRLSIFSLGLSAGTAVEQSWTVASCPFRAARCSVVKVY